MKRVYHVQGHDLEELDYFANMDIYNGDVYGFDDPDQNIIWIWVGSKSSVEESTVAAWLVNKIDKERGGVPEVITIEEGKEPMPFKEAWSINVIEEDTPGFLKKAELDLVEFKLFRVYIEVDTAALDEAKLEQVDISRDSLMSDDVYILDGNEAIYCWIGKNSQIEEKQMGQKLMQKIDADRHFLPLQYTIYEGDNDNTEEAFFDLIDRLEKLDPTERKSISVEDTREQEYVAEEAKSVEDHKQDVDSSYETIDPDKVPERVVEARSDEHKEMVTQSSVSGPDAGSIAAAGENLEEIDPDPDGGSIQPMGGSEETSSISSESSEVDPLEEDTANSEGAEMPSAPTDMAEQEPESTETVTSSEGSEGDTTEDTEADEPGEMDSKTPTTTEIPTTEVGESSDDTVADDVIADTSTVSSITQEPISAKSSSPNKENGKPSYGGGAPVPELGELEQGTSSDSSTVSDEVTPESENQESTAPTTSSVEPESQESSEDVVPEADIPITKSEPEPAPTPEPEPVVQSTPEPEPAAKSTPNKVKTDCPAHKMHAQIWRGDNACHVCGMKESDCPESDEHWDYWMQKDECPTCKVSSR